jgi:adenylate kinase
MDNKKYIVIILGPQGSGKGTQGKRLALKLGALYLDTGSLLRDEIASKSEDGKYISSIIDSGNLLPDEYISGFMKNKILSALKKSSGVVVDGFPRSIAQAEAFESLAKPTHVLLIEIDDNESVRRLSGRRQCPKDGTIYNMITDPPKIGEKCDKCSSSLVQRIDDTPEAIKKRLNLYHENTKPIAKRYEAIGILHKINGMFSIEEVESLVWKIFKHES